MIKAKLILASQYLNHKPIYTFELEYPRYIHSEFMTHRQISKNSASSRAIPIKKVVEHIQQYPQLPQHWGKNQSGMQAKEELNAQEIERARELWLKARDAAVEVTLKLDELGLHKQAANRLTEPFQTMKVVATATDWSNLLYLRCHKDAQPEFQILANLIRENIDSVKPQELSLGDWHLPYIHFDPKLKQYSNNGEILTLEQAKMLSVSLCAQVSYRVHNDSLEKALSIYDRLINSKPVHASPTEHQATPIDYPDREHHYWNWPNGITHVDKHGKLHSGNFTDWIQFRQTLENHDYQ